jgi:hypothetical protein
VALRRARAFFPAFTKQYLMLRTFLHHSVLGSAEALATLNHGLARPANQLRQPFAPGLEAAETIYRAHGWQAPRRLVVVRQLLDERSEAHGRKLLEVPGYTFQVLVTTLGHDPVHTWRFYNSRAESENRIKELKEDFGADGFCLQSFDGTEAAFRLICFLFNLIADFKREVTQDQAPRLATLRTQVLVVGAILGREGRHTVLRLGLRGGDGAGASPRCWNVSPRSPFQLWRSSLTMPKTPCPGPGNRVAEPTDTL